MHLLKSLGQSTLDIRLLWGSVFLRMASYGLTNQVLTLYLESLAISPEKIGIFMTLTLIGDAAISYILTWYADRIGRRVIMMLGTAMMLASGLVFALCSNYVILLTAATLGVISPSGDETGPFKSVEEAVIAHLTPANHMPEIFAFHGLFATAGVALGSLLSGLLVDYLNLGQGYPLEKCYRIVFVAYALFGLAKLVLMLQLSEKCEVDYIPNAQELEETSEAEDTPLLKKNLSQTTSYYLPRLLAIFMLDSLGYGFMPSAWIVYYLKKTFEISASGLGVLYFFANAVDAFSSLPSAFLAKLLGPVMAILGTQAPSAIFVGSVAFTQSLPIVICLLLGYYTTSTMDVVPRQVLLASIMPKKDLTKVLGIVNIGKTFARCVGPIFTGKLASHSKLRYGFVINGGCVLLADLVLATNFLHLDGQILRAQKVDHMIE
ncbi:MFS general substrate transporter [Suhomyces tanzawaensis NRRL Y-17324]|uniref:MFS general substrate transporter n=1 Tax=Suhomyces tanzawaensis NRRL Y-17324 TaxID=984487 RepID=A0A1E4SI21_9ASCO|nr:MFS general substrate transporter [Suhomyces tanzawaensis NRRL Y-17324]ODV79146.1 MFS general substrate transporter [Suhomyces tanzawaensis NRRL Y-17324]